MSEGRTLKYILNMVDQYTAAVVKRKKEKDINHLKNKLGASLRMLCEVHERLKIDEEMRERLKEPNLGSFKDVILRSDLYVHIPVVKELDPEEVFELWKEMPKITLNTEAIFTGALALLAMRIGDNEPNEQMPEEPTEEILEAMIDAGARRDWAKDIYNAIKEQVNK